MHTNADTLKQLLEQYKNKKVFLTGHTGFKGSWMCMLLKMLGADVTGYAKEPDTDFFRLSRGSEGMHSIEGDIRDLNGLRSAFEQCRPDYVFHMAAQPIVRESYKNPVETYETNVMGTVYLMECIRLHSYVKSVLNITTDKVYENNEWVWGYRETDRINGFDPYSNSKSCSELATGSYFNSFLKERSIPVSTARAGNVIGGGDFAKDRIIPDCVRSVLSREKIMVRNPGSVRPFQHVLEPLCAYLMIAAAQERNEALAGSYNVGPEEDACITTGKLTDLFCEIWGEGAEWEAGSVEGPHEAGFLKLDCSKIRQAIGWKPQWGIETAVKKTVDWVKCYDAGEDVTICMREQIQEYFRLAAK